MYAIASQQADESLRIIQPSYLCVLCLRRTLQTSQQVTLTFAPQTDSMFKGHGEGRIVDFDIFGRPVRMFCGCTFEYLDRVSPVYAIRMLRLCISCLNCMSECAGDLGQVDPRQKPPLPGGLSCSVAALEKRRSRSSS